MPMPPAPASVVQDSHYYSYYTLSVFQNNVKNSFDENFIDMEKAEIKQGKAEIKQGKAEIKQGKAEIKQGKAEIKQGKAAAAAWS